MTEQLIERIYRRVMMMVGRGRVTTGDDSGLVQVLQVSQGAAELRDDLPRLAEYGFASFPQPGADVIAVFLGGDRSNGCVIATGDNRYRLHLKPGEVAIHDDLGHRVYLTRTGIAIDGGGHDLTISNAPHVVLTGGDFVADGIGLKSHHHTGTQPGSGNSGPAAA